MKLILSSKAYNNNNSNNSNNNNNNNINNNNNNNEINNESLGWDETGGVRPAVNNVLLQITVNFIVNLYL